MRMAAANFQPRNVAETKVRIRFALAHEMRNKYSLSRTLDQHSAICKEQVAVRCLEVPLHEARRIVLTSECLRKIHNTGDGHGTVDSFDGEPPKVPQRGEIRFVSKMA